MKPFLPIARVLIGLAAAFTWCCGGTPPAAPGGAGTTPPDVSCNVYPPQATSPYVLPYARGTAAFVGNTTGHGDPQRYAVDFVMPIGSPIVAARSGQVVGIEGQFVDTDHVFGHENYVAVQHDDGTVGEYAHLTHEGAVVAVGQAVEQGQLIGRSGHSGNSTAPHLHFHVNRCFVKTPSWLNLPSDCAQSLPLTFRNTESHPCGLVVGRVYQAS